MTPRAIAGIGTLPPAPGPAPAGEEARSTAPAGRYASGRSAGASWCRAAGFRWGRVAIPSLLAGAGLAFSLPPWGWWPLAFAGAALLYWRLRGLGWRTRFLAGWLAGLACFVPGLWWAAAFNWYGAAVLMVVEALSMAVAALAVPPVRWRIPAFAGSFTLLEAVRQSWPFGGLPLGGVFLGQAGGPLLATARLGGPLLMTGLVWLGGAGLAEIASWLARAASGRRGRRALPSVAGVAGVGDVAGLAAGVVAAILVVTVVALGDVAPDGGTGVSTVRVAAVQGGGRRGVSAAEVDPSVVLTAELAATSMLARHEGTARASLVVWPEDVISVGPHLAGTAATALMAAVARRLHATVVAGVTETVSSTAFRNEAVAWGPSGRVVAVYEKVHRVPFGEYVPDRSFFAHFANLSAVPLDAVPGHGSGYVHTPAAPIGLMVSYEVFFADRGRDAVRAGARLLVVPTNTSSYASTQVPSNEVAADRVQAVAEGRDLVQAAPAGYSTVVTNTGQVVMRTALGRRQVLVATVDLRTGTTLYEAVGDVPALALAALALAVALGLSLRAALGARRRGAGRA